MNQSDLISAAAEHHALKYMVRFRNWPVRFFTLKDDQRKSFELVSREEASTFPDQPTACRVARDHDMRLDEIEIVTLSGPFIVHPISGPAPAVPNSPKTKMHNA